MHGDREGYVPAAPAELRLGAGGWAHAYPCTGAGWQERPLLHLSSHCTLAWGTLSLPCNRESPHPSRPSPECRLLQEAHLEASSLPTPTFPTCLKPVCEGNPIQGRNPTGPRAARSSVFLQIHQKPFQGRAWPSPWLRRGRRVPWTPGSVLRGTLPSHPPCLLSSSPQPFSPTLCLHTSLLIICFSRLECKLHQDSCFCPVSSWLYP